MKPKITIIDYGVGNIFSVKRAFEHCGALPQLSRDVRAIELADRVVLPGVGAFADGMSGLRQYDLIEPIQRFAATGRPMLGICLGMQMLSTISEEFGEHQGLHLIPGRVAGVPKADINNVPHKIPHVGWSGISPAAFGSWQNTPLADTKSGDAVYLVHSYHMTPDDPAHLLAVCDYGGHQITAAVGSNNVFGAQFHPEKSGSVGLAMLSTFLRL